MLLKQLLRPTHHDSIVIITKEFLDLLKVPVTITALTKALEEHPDYPSLLSISDVLTSYGIENISIKTTLDKLLEFPLPCIAQIKDQYTLNDEMAIIVSLSEDQVEWFNPTKGRIEKITNADFERQWISRIALLADAKKAKGDEMYRQHRLEEKRLYTAQVLSFWTLPLLVFIMCIFSIAIYGSQGFLPVIFTLSILIGCITSSLLLWYEVDQYNPILEQICSIGKKVNCGAILNAKAAKIGGISWSSVGFTYFIGSLLLLMFFSLISSEALFITSGLNLLAIPYVFFSIYYQWRIAKQWCLMCLCVQGVLVIQLITALVAGWHRVLSMNALLNFQTIFAVATSYLLPFIMVNLLLPAYRAAKESKRSKNELQRLKHNPEVFEALLSRQKTVTQDTTGLGIVLGNPNAKYKLIKVCNPYCGPCAKAHKPMEELLSNNFDLQIQILFNATNEEGDIKAPPVKHFLAIAEKNDESLMQKALDDWYLADEKSYEVFACKYPMNLELDMQEEKLIAMTEWCKRMEVSATPTFFINGYQLPPTYGVNDLKYFFTI